MTSSHQNKTTTAALATTLIAGIDQHLAKTSSIVLAGTSYTPQQVAQRLQQIVDLRSEVTTSKSTTKAKLVAEKAELPALLKFMDVCKTFVKATYDGSPDVLADFGISTKARTSMSVEAKLVAAAKRKATRAARHTMGSQQKKGIKGSVAGVVVTPISTSSPVAMTPVSGSTPAASAPATTHT